MPLPPRVLEKINNINNLILRNSDLDIKTKALIAITASVSSYCSHCRGQSKKIGRNLGLTDIEIAEAEEIAILVRKKCPNETGFFRID